MVILKIESKNPIVNPAIKLKTKVKQIIQNYLKRISIIHLVKLINLRIKWFVNIILIQISDQRKNLK